MNLRSVAYIVSRFPKITETFVLNEMVALEKAGVGIEVLALVREKEPVQHPEAARFVERALFLNFRAATPWLAFLWWLGRRPATLLGTWLTVLWGHRGSPKYLLRAAGAALAGGYFAAEIKRRPIDHIHAHWATHATTAAYVVHRLTGVPFSFTGHAHDIYVHQSMLEEKVRTAAFMVTISDYNRRFLAERLGPALAEKIEVIRCGVDTRLFQPPPVDRSTERPLQLVCVGRLEAKKGQRYLLEACRLLTDQGLPFHLRLIGGGDDFEALAAQIHTAGLGGQVELLGHQPRSAVLEALACSDIVVLPSITLENGKKEGIPVALMEALAMGRPAVASRLSGIPELLVDGETGLLVPEKDPAALAAAISRLAGDPALRRRLGTAGRARVERDYDLHANTGRLLARINHSLARPVYPAAQGKEKAPEAIGQGEWASK